MTSIVNDKYVSHSRNSAYVAVVIGSINYIDLDRAGCIATHAIHKQVTTSEVVERFDNSRNIQSPPEFDLLTRTISSSIFQLRCELR